MKISLELKQHINEKQTKNSKNQTESKLTGTTNANDNITKMFLKKRTMHIQIKNGTSIFALTCIGGTKTTFFPFFDCFRDL